LNPEAALKQFTESDPNEKYPTVKVLWGLALFGRTTFQNPNYIEPKKAVVGKIEKSHPQQPARSGEDSEWLKSLGKAAKNIRDQAVPPESSGWATLYRVWGWIGIVVGIIGFIIIAPKNVEAGFIFALWTILPALTCFLFAFLIDVLTDMRHYLKRIAEKQ